jgi:RNA polymerase sigma-70 factor (ECF subfamily)
LLPAEPESSVAVETAAAGVLSEEGELLLRLSEERDPGERERIFADLFGRHERRLRSVATNVLRDSDEACDAVQETMLSAWGAIGRFRGESALATWLIRICVRECVDRLRARRARERLLQLWPFRPGARSFVPPDDRGDHALRRRIDLALARLPARQRTVLALRAFEEMTIPEIARTLGLAEGTVKVHLFRATRAMKSLLQEVAP